MKFLAAVLSVVVFAAFGLAQDCNKGPAPQAPAKTFRPALDLSNLGSSQAARDEESLFKATGPTLFTMDEALRVSAKTGKPVVCWMGAGIFRNANARAVSRELGDTTIQAVMDSDGQTVDGNGKALPELRVKFSDSNYGNDAKVAFIPVSQLNKDSGRKILSFARGGSSK